MTQNQNSKTPLLSVKNLIVEFKTDHGTVRAIDDISFDIMEGETLGIVGESGCGKSVTAMSILGLIPSPPGRIVSGSITFRGTDLTKMSEKQLRSIRGRDIAMIFQDPMTALNPVYTIGNQMIDVIRQHKGLGRYAARKTAIEMLKVVGISDAERRVEAFPHELSGGMRQRVMIAMALSCGPRLLLADEPTTALDVTTQAQVLDEMTRLQNTFKMAIALVTHDMGVIAESCERVIVMYCGKIVEIASVQDIFKNPKHPYTRGLLDSIPRIRETKLDRLPVIEGMVPHLAALPPGCRFADRCPKAQKKCSETVPHLRNVANSVVACFFPEGEAK